MDVSERGRQVGSRERAMVPCTGSWYAPTCIMPPAVASCSSAGKLWTGRPPPASHGVPGCNIVRLTRVVILSSAAYLRGDRITSPLRCREGLTMVRRRGLTTTVES